jgi:ATP-dependent Lon protease
LLNREKEVAKMQREISEQVNNRDNIFSQLIIDQVEKKVSKQQREYMLKEQLKAINKVPLL